MAHLKFACSFGDLSRSQFVLRFKPAALDNSLNGQSITDWPYRGAGYYFVWQMKWPFQADKTSYSYTFQETSSIASIEKFTLTASSLKICHWAIMNHAAWLALIVTVSKLWRVQTLTSQCFHCSSCPRVICDTFLRAWIIDASEISVSAVLRSFFKGSKTV